MNIQGLNPIASTGGGDSLQGITRTTGGDGFGRVMDRLMQESLAPQQEANQAMAQLMTGQINDLHSVTIPVVRSELAFRLALEIRNRVTDAYQEVMRMQI